MDSTELGFIFDNCKHCHQCGVLKGFPAFVMNGKYYRNKCKSCASDNAKEKYNADPEAAKAKTRAWREANPEKAKAQTYAWRENNPERFKEYMTQYGLENKQKRIDRENKDREGKLKKSKDYYQKRRDEILAFNRANPEIRSRQTKAQREANPGHYQAKSAEKWARKKQACPKWLNAGHHAEIYGYYLYCSIFDDHEVDHIMPLKGKEICGLHVPWNLQPLHYIENIRKFNHMPDPTTIAPYIERPTLVIDADGFASLKFEE